MQERFAQAFTWNRLGDLESQTYPECETASLCATGANGNPVTNYPRTASHGYTRGWLTGVTYNGSSSGTLSYLDSGMIGSVTHGNGVVLTQSQDPTSMLRPARFQAIKGANTHWDTGQYGYAYDGMGENRREKLTPL